MDNISNETKRWFIGEVNISKSWVGWIEFIFFLIGTPLNIWLLYLGLLLARKKRALLNQPLIVSMTTADLLFCVTNCPLMFVQYGLKIDLTELCIIMYVSTYVCTVASSLSILALNVDKYFNLTHPLRYQLYVTRRRIYAAAISCWIIAIGFSLFFIFGPVTVYRSPCDFKPRHVELYMTFLFVFFTLPSITSTLVASHVLRIIERRSKEEHKLGRTRTQRDSNSSCSYKNRHKETIDSTMTTEEIIIYRNNKSTKLLNSSSDLKVMSVNAGNENAYSSNQMCRLILRASTTKLRRRNAMAQSNGQQRNTWGRHQMRFVMFVFSTSVWGAITTLPYRILYTIYIMCFSTNNTKYDLFLLIYIRSLYSCIVLLTSNAVGNPLLTLLTHRQYKNIAIQKCPKLLQGILGLKNVSKKYSTTSTSFATKRSISCQQ